MEACIHCTSLFSKHMNCLSTMKMTPITSGSICGYEMWWCHVNNMYYYNINKHSHPLTRCFACCQCMNRITTLGHFEGRRRCREAFKLPAFITSFHFIQPLQLWEANSFIAFKAGKHNRVYYLLPVVRYSSKGVMWNGNHFCWSTMVVLCSIVYVQQP